MQTQPPIRLQAVGQLAKCQGVPVVVQLLALARPMALQEQAAAILQATFSSPSYCIVNAIVKLTGCQFCGFCISSAGVSSNVPQNVT